MGRTPGNLPSLGGLRQEDRRRRQAHEFDGAATFELVINSAELGARRFLDVDRKRRKNFRSSAHKSEPHFARIAPAGNTGILCPSQTLPAASAAT